MDSQTTQTIKLPILQPGEYDLWKMRMDQRQHPHQQTVEAEGTKKAEFRDNTATKKTQKNLLKKQYENFVASITELDNEDLQQIDRSIIFEKEMDLRKENGAPIIEDWVSESEEEDVPKIKTVEMFNKPSFAKINFVKSTKQVKSPRKTSVDKNRQNTPSPKGNKRY
ncbi:hypothetical protein Tco_0098942 [Tanacetum coccineum]